MTDLSDPADDMTCADRRLLARIEAYCDLVPRADTVAYALGPFTLFVSRGGPGAYDYYARPTLGLDRPVTVADVVAVLDRQDELGVPRALEWVDETSPSLLAAARGAGLVVQRCPLLVLVGAPVGPLVQEQVRVLHADDPELA
ncbi:MAG: hypothetical protein M3Y71_00195, partial [Actinomycetota bacterium]|nr:hypothetical protein [Actinomycetota bacterium]